MATSTTHRRIAAGLLVVALGLGGCRSGGSEAGPSAGSGTQPEGATTTAATTAGVPSAGARLAPGPVVLVCLGDSLTAGQGEDPERGYPGRIGDALERGGHAGSTVQNLGRSGWDSQQVIDGAQGDRGQLPAALEFLAQAKEEGKPAVATLLVGSNDLWYLYDDDAPTPADEERADLEHYRDNVRRIVDTLRGAGAQVVLGINDDQSKRPVVANASIRVNTFPGLSEEESRRMSEQARRYAGVVREIAASTGALVADFLDAPLFARGETLADDGMHPNKAGYDEMTTVWLDAMKPLLG